MRVDAAIPPHKHEMKLPRRQRYQRDIPTLPRAIDGNETRTRQRIGNPRPRPPPQRIIAWPDQPPPRRRIGRPHQSDTVEPRRWIIALWPEPRPDQPPRADKGAVAQLIHRDNA